MVNRPERRSATARVDIPVPCRAIFSLSASTEESPLVKRPFIRTPFCSTSFTNQACRVNTFYNQAKKNLPPLLPTGLRGFTGNLAPLLLAELLRTSLSSLQATQPAQRHGSRIPSV